MLNLCIYFGIRYPSLGKYTSSLRDVIFNVLQGNEPIMRRYKYSDQLSCYFHYPVKFKLLEKTIPEAINKEAGRFGE
jgi:hypothetical protein